MKAKKLSRVLALALALPLLAGTMVALPKSTSASAASYTKAVDCSWLPAMESNGVVFKNSSGTAQNLMTILQGESVKLIRIRLFVNPSSDPYNGQCNETADIALAKRAVAIGAQFILDFHYSDTWADPGHQTIPAAWTGDTTISELGTQVYNYTDQVMTDFKNAGVTPNYVQIGNEINSGLIWPLGNTSNGFSNVAWIINSGYNAVKAVNSGTTCIVHLANGYDTSDFTWFFSGLQGASGSWDMCGMSMYPSSSNYSSYCSELETTMSDMQSSYGKSSAVCEAGFLASDPTDGSAFMSLLASDVSAKGGKFISYWEPEAYNWNSYTLGAWNSSTEEPTSVMTSF